MLDHTSLYRTAAFSIARCFKAVCPSATLVGPQFFRDRVAYDFILPKGERQSWNETALPGLERSVADFAKQARSVNLLTMIPKVAIQYLAEHDCASRGEAVGGDEGLVSIACEQAFVDVVDGPLFEKPFVVSLLSIESIEDVLRITAVPAFDRKQLKAWRKGAKTIEKKDHRRLGPEYARGSGSLALGPKGCGLKESLYSYWRERHPNIVTSPAFVKEAELKPYWRLGRNWSKDLLTEVWGEPYRFLSDGFFLRALYGQSHRSSEWRTIFLEQPPDRLDGWHDLLSFTQDQTTSVIERDSLVSEIISSLQFITETIKMVGLDYCIALSSKRTGRSKWNRGVDALKQGAKEVGIPIDSEGSIARDTVLDSVYPGKGPRMAILLKDPAGRTFEGPFVGVDIHLAECFNLWCRQTQEPAVVVYSCFGSVERYMSILLENGLTGWLTPFRAGKE